MSVEVFLRLGCWCVSSGFRLATSLLVLEVFFFLEECNTSTTRSQRSRAVTPSMRRPVSKETTSDSAELCETEVCF